MLPSNSIRILLLGLTCPVLVAAPLASAPSSPQPALPLLALLPPPVLPPGPAAVPQDTAPQDSRPDQIYRKNPRNGRVTTVTGQVQENTLSAVKFLAGKKEESIPSAQILRIEWGATPRSYADGQIHSNRKQYEQALAQFRIAATDASTRPVVQADARLRAVKALMAWAAVEPERFTEAIEEADKFLTDFPSDRALPEAMMIKARALRLAGKPAEAAAIYEALYQEGVAGTKGYDPSLCLEAGLEGAQSYLEANDTLKARELFGAAEAGFTELHGASVDATSLEKMHMLNQAGAASVGEGFCLLATSDADRAKSFFESALNKRDNAPAAQHAARLGLAQIHLAAGEAKQAEFMFAQVSALDSTSRDRVAAALLGLAASAQASGSDNGLKVARTSLRRIQEAYGDTPSAAEAKTRLSKL